jgi:hypothetical protein
VVAAVECGSTQCGYQCSTGLAIGTLNYIFISIVQIHFSNSNTFSIHQSGIAWTSERETEIAQTMQKQVRFYSSISFP